jgi:hypothetical protein
MDVRRRQRVELALERRRILGPDRLQHLEELVGARPAVFHLCTEGIVFIL